MNELKVGDELVFTSLGGNLYLFKIDHITSSGRIKCGNIYLNPDLTIRGEFSTDYIGKAVPATDKHRKQIHDREEKLSLISDLKQVVLGRLTNDQLRRMVEITEESL